MPSARQINQDTADQLAFKHYLRTGERLTSGEWLGREEAKFNPYHDDLGRFTFGPGSTGARRPVYRSARPEQGRVSDQAPGSPGRAVSPRLRDSGNGFRSDLVRGAVASSTNSADTYFELNKRQVVLDRLRKQAGAHPSAAVVADLTDFQRRIDANRVILDARHRIADKQIHEVLRAGLSPYDMAAGGAAIATGTGEVRDYLAVSGALPLGGVVSKLGKVNGVAKVAETAAPQVEQLGGAYRAVRKLRGYHAHHLVADSISPMAKGDGAAIATLPKDHIGTGSYGNSRAAKEFRRAQKTLIDKGNFRGALNMGILDIRKKFGRRYDQAIKMAIKYIVDKGK